MRAAIVFLGILMSNAVRAAHDVPRDREANQILWAVFGVCLAMDIWEWAVYVFGKKERQ